MEGAAANTRAVWIERQLTISPRRQLPTQFAMLPAWRGSRHAAWKAGHRACRPSSGRVTPPPHSRLRATSGSIRVARRAGMYDAAIVTRAKNHATATNVIGSSGVMPKSMP